MKYDFIIISNLCFRNKPVYMKIVYILGLSDIREENSISHDIELRSIMSGSVSNDQYALFIKSLIKLLIGLETLNSWNKKGYFFNHSLFEVLLHIFQTLFNFQI